MSNTSQRPLLPSSSLPTRGSKCKHCFSGTFAWVIQVSFLEIGSYPFLGWLNYMIFLKTHPSFDLRAENWKWMRHGTCQSAHIKTRDEEGLRRIAMTKSMTGRTYPGKSCYLPQWRRHLLPRSPSCGCTMGTLQQQWVQLYPRHSSPGGRPAWTAAPGGSTAEGIT